MAKHYKIRQGVLIEPVETCLPELKRRFPGKNYQIINVAVSDKRGAATFNVYEEFNAVSSLFDYNRNELQLHKPQKVTVSTDSIDNIAKQCHLQDVDILKIDVQGAEHLVLAGASKTLKKTKLVYTEISFKPLYENSSTFFDLHKIMTENNFRMVNLSEGYKTENGELLQGDALFINNDLL